MHEPCHHRRQLHVRQLWESRRDSLGKKRSCRVERRTVFIGRLSPAFFPIRPRIGLALIVSNLFVGVVIGFPNCISVNRDSNTSKRVVGANGSIHGLGRGSR